MQTALPKPSLLENYLNRLFKNPHTPKPQLVSETYGEILHPSVTKLLSQITLSDQDIFYDLGSGYGKLAMHFFLQTSIKAAIGIELSSTLHEQAQKALETVQNELPEYFENQRKLTFVQGSFLELPLTDATIVFICAPCYTQPMMNALGKIIQDTTSIHTVLTLRPLNTLQRLPLKKIVRVEGSWDSSLCYIYSMHCL
jgi:SAM-dependent methyltransferase